MLKVHRVKECILARTNEIDGNSSVMLNHGVYRVFGAIWMFSAGLPFPIPSLCITFQSILKHRAANNCRYDGNVIHIDRYMYLDRKAMMYPTLLALY